VGLLFTTQPDPPDAGPNRPHGLTQPMTARGVAHLVVHGTTGSTSYETIPPFVRLESSGARRAVDRGHGGATTPLLVELKKLVKLLVTLSLTIAMHNWPRIKLWLTVERIWRCQHSMRWRVCVTVRCPSVRPSVCPVDRSLLLAAAWARAAHIHRQIIK